MEIQHDEKLQKFFVEVDGDEAVLDYRLSGDTMNFYHTYVPPSVRGKGIAEKIVKAGFEYAREKHYQVIPSCSYISDIFLRRYQQYQAMVK